MSERVPEAKVVSNRLARDCWKQSHVMHVKLKCEGSKHAVRIGTRLDRWVHGFVDAWLASHAISSESSALLELR